MINIGQYIEMAINWMMIHFSTFFDAVNAGIGSFIIGFQHILFGIPFYITILVLAALAWMKAGRGTAIFTALGLLLIYRMDHPAGFHGSFGFVAGGNADGKYSAFGYSGCFGCYDLPL